MKTENELYAAILKITMKIKVQFPELSIYILEIPETIPNVKNSVMIIKVLQEYYDSLCALLTDYIDNQIIISKLF